jgi:hypothetical protein
MNNDDFVKEYNAIVERALMFVEKATHEGFLSIEDLIDEEKYMQRDIFEYGLKLITDGFEDEYVNTILENIVELETNKEKKVLKEIQQDAVYGIQHGWDQRKLLMLLNSHVDIDVENTMKRCKEMYSSEIELAVAVKKYKEKYFVESQKSHLKER